MDLKQQLTVLLASLGCETVYFEETVSTNAVLRQLAEVGAEEGLVVVCERQTAGRGRLGRSFLSPRGGIYFSLLLRPSGAPETALLATSAAAVAVCHALERAAGKECKIKWVNDVYIGERKVCGILTEGAFDGASAELRYMIVGIGINLTEPAGGFAPEISERAAAVFGEKELTANQKAEIVADVIKELRGFCARLSERSFCEEYRARSYLDGKTVCYERDGAVYSGIVRGIDSEMRLLIEQDGGLLALGAGEVSVKPQTADNAEEFSR